MAFVSNRHIIDRFVIAEEIIHSWKKNKEWGLLVKLDFEKTYDSIDHVFLDNMLESMGFGSRWRNWMRNCVSSPLLSILVNGCPTPEFGIERGLRQRDPLSPFLFNITIEGLNDLFRKAMDSNMVKGASFGKNDVQVSHLQFADDMILFLQPNMEYF